MTYKVKVAGPRRSRGSRISGKNQLTIPVDALAKAGLKSGDTVTVKVAKAGVLHITRVEDPTAAYAGALKGAYGKGYLEELRNEWE